jgi:hypothetical protein
MSNQKFPKTTKVEVRIEDKLLCRIPEKPTPRNLFINDAIREKLDGPGRSAAAAAMGRATSEKKTTAARLNAKKPRPRKNKNPENETP